mmetsp:Transcript_13590/g.13655  ORF Transcript_13590/g.13655 Transcript_13590/m.13655 type:complete len:110 (-) Transcript_13590:202-531(-)
MLRVYYRSVIFSVRDSIWYASAAHFSSEIKNPRNTNNHSSHTTSTTSPPPNITDSQKVKSINDDSDEDLIDMFTKGPAGVEWGGPTKGGKFPEPTRFGDWERKGRTTDF